MPILTVIFMAYNCYSVYSCSIVVNVPSVMGFSDSSGPAAAYEHYVRLCTIVAGVPVARGTHQDAHGRLRPLQGERVSLPQRAVLRTGSHDRVGLWNIPFRGDMQKTPEGT